MPQQNCTEIFFKPTYSTKAMTFCVAIWIWAPFLIFMSELFRIKKVKLSGFIQNIWPEIPWLKTKNGRIFLDHQIKVTHSFCSSYCLLTWTLKPSKRMRFISKDMLNSIITNKMFKTIRKIIPLIQRPLSFDWGFAVGQRNKKLLRSVL